MLSIALLAAGLREESEPFSTAAQEAEAEADKMENRHAERSVKQIVADVRARALRCICGTPGME